MPSTFHQLRYHIVFATKGRQSWIDASLEETLYRYIRGIVKGEGGLLLAIGGMPDHVHLLTAFKPTTTLSKAVKQIKGSSSKWVNDLPAERPHFAWQEGYSIFTVSASGIGAVRSYIARQKQHHRSRSSKDELRTLLSKSGVDFDESDLEA